jgi:hypothetical protein
LLSIDLSQVFLIDFGLVKLVNADHCVSTKTLNCGWSHPYVAPEYMKPPHKYDQFCEVYLEHQLACFHIAERNEGHCRKEEERRQEEDAQKHKEILEKFQHVAVFHEQLADGQLECPKLYVIARPSNNRGRWAPQFRNLLRTKQTYFLYFLCEHNLTKIDHAIELQKDTEWFAKAAPALILSLTLIRVAVMLGAGAAVAGIFANWLEQIGLNSLVTEDNLTQVFNAELVSLDLMDRLRNMDLEQGESSWESIQSEIKRVSPSCYSTIAELAKKDSKWRDEMTWTIRTKKVDKEHG